MLQLNLDFIREGSDPFREVVLHLEVTTITFNSFTRLKDLLVVHLETMPGLETTHLLAAEHFGTHI